MPLKALQRPQPNRRRRKEWGKTVQNGQTKKTVQSHKTLKRKELAQWYELGL
jgi:hypothetical protein